MIGSEKLSSEERDILTTCATLMREIQEQDVPEEDDYWARLEYDELKEHGPRYVPRTWFGGGSPVPERYRVRYLRALHNLAGRGLVSLATGSGGRTENVKLTAKGWAAVEGIEGKAKAKGKKPARKPVAGNESPPAPTATSYERYREEAAANPNRVQGRHIDPIPAIDGQPGEPAGGGE